MKRLARIIINTMPFIAAGVLLLTVWLGVLVTLDIEAAIALKRTGWLVLVALGSAATYVPLYYLNAWAKRKLGIYF